MEKQLDELTNSAMQMILKAGDARLHIQKALDEINVFAFEDAKKNLKTAENFLQEAHRTQTEIIQNEARGNTYEYSMLFAHAQDTMMSVQSELLLVKKMTAIFKTMNDTFVRKDEHHE